MCAASSRPRYEVGRYNVATHDCRRRRHRVVRWGLCVTRCDLGQWRNYNFCPPPANIRYGLTVLIHNSGHFRPPLDLYRFGPLGPSALPGLPMASYATDLDERHISTGQRVNGDCRQSESDPDTCLLGDLENVSN